VIPRPLLRMEARLQLRGGFVAAYAFLAALYAVLLASLPPGAREAALPPVLLTETAVVGFFFAGTLLHLERAEGALDALAVTPVPPAALVLARALSLAALAAPAALAMGWAATGGRARLPLLLAAAGLATAFFVAAGLAVASRFDSLERFAIWGGLGTTLLGLPVLPYLGIAPSAAWALHPTFPTVALLASACGAGIPGAPPLAALLALHLAWLAAVVVLAARWIGRFGFGRAP
jgi:fluoroquinolone transport system permease protein